MQSVRLHLCGVQTRRQDLGVQPPGLGEDGHVPTILGTFALATEEILGKYTEGYTGRGCQPALLAIRERDRKGLAPPGQVLLQISRR